MLFHVIPAGRRRTEVWAEQRQRAVQLGRRLGVDDALDLARAALAVADGGLSPDGVGDLMGGAGEGATRAQATRVVGRLGRDAELVPLLGPFLRGVANGPGLSVSTWRRLASDADTAAYVPAVLDSLSARDAEALSALLLVQPRAHAALANHLRTSPRYAATRAERLLDLAEATDEEHLPTVLDQFGVIQGSVGVPDTLRSRLLAQVLRAIRTAPLDRRSTGDIADTYELIVTWGDDSWLAMIAARREAMLASTSKDRYRMELIPDQLAVGLHRLSVEQRDAAIPQIATWLEQSGSGPLAWRVALGLADLLVRVGAGRPTLPGIIAEWYRRGSATRGIALGLFAGLWARNALIPVLDEILADVGAVADSGQLMAALAVPPSSWAGDLEQEYQRRADALRPGSRRGRRHARELTRLAVAHLEHLAAEERSRTHALKDSYTA